MDHPTSLMLESIALLGGLGEEARKQLAQKLWIENRRRGEQLLPCDHFKDRVWFLFRGVVELYTLTQRGGRKILFFCGAGELLNMNVSGACPDRHFGRCATDAILLTMDRRDFAEVVLQSPELTKALFVHYEERLWRLSHQLKNTAGSAYVERKLAAKLLKLSSDFGRPQDGGVVIPFDLTVTQMADYVGVPRESASRACSKLQEMGLVRYESRRFFLPDPVRLECFRRQAP